MADDTPPTSPFNLKSAMRFLALSGVSFVLKPGSTALMHEVVGLPVRIAYAIALVLVFVVNFLLMRYLIYGRSKKGAGGQFVGFGAATVIFRLAEYGSFLALSSVCRVHYLIIIIGVSVVFAVLKYFFYGSTIFKPSEG